MIRIIIILVALMSAGGLCTSSWWLRGSPLGLLTPPRTLSESRTRDSHAVDEYQQCSSLKAPPGPHPRSPPERPGPRVIGELASVAIWTETLMNVPAPS